MKMKYLRQRMSAHNMKLWGLREWFIEIGRMTFIIQWRTPRAKRDLDSS